MKNIFAFFLIASLLLAGCAKQATMDEQPAPEVAPVVEQAPPAAVEPAAPAEVPVAETKAAVEPAALQIFFEFDSHLLTADSKGALYGNALWLQAQPEVRVLIEGYTDERGSSSYNLALGEKRAQAARNYLLNLGIAPERISIISYGKEKAKSANDESIWAKDRRAEFVKTN